MTYLIVPVLCFVVLAGLIKLAMGAMSRQQTGQKTWVGRIKGLDVILSVLMTAKHFEPSLVIKDPDGVTSSWMTFADSAVKLKIPLAALPQSNGAERALVIMREIGLDARISGNGGANNSLVCEIDGPPAKAASVIKKLFAELFGVHETALLDFGISASRFDLVVIEEALKSNQPGDNVGLPVAASSRTISPADAREKTNGCMTSLAGILLLPVLFMAAYLEFGYIAASAVLMVIFLSRNIYLRWKKSRWGIRSTDLIGFTIFGLAGATINFNEPVYLQLIPTIVFCVAASIEITLISFGRPPLLEYSDPLPKRGRLLFSFGIVTTCIGGAALNEYLRGTLTLDAWMWFFAFARIELVLGALVSFIPLLVYQSKTMGTNNDDQNGATGITDAS